MSGIAYPITADELVKLIERIDKIGVLRNELSSVRST